MQLNTLPSSEIYPFKLPELPYAEDALEPHMSSKTFSFHYKKHHNAYVVKLNELLESTNLKNKTLIEIIEISHNDSKLTAMFNNAAQVWNHTFFWHCMKKDGGGAPKGRLGEMIETAFGSYDQFKEEFKAAAISQFGSGWAWLVYDGNALSIKKTPNADNPILHSLKPLLTVDVWEHAYYLDYQNRRPDYVDVFLEHLVNWDFVEKCLND
jgi:superoxide dismutase, Fe-Mn family